MADLRASDEQRERTAQELRDHFAAGRLTQEELDERVQHAYAARTQQQLRDLLADLPGLPITPQQQKAALAVRRSQLQRRLIQETAAVPALFAVCVAIWLIDGAQGQFWPVWVAIVVLIPLLRNAWRLYGPAPQLDRVERELDRRSRRGGRRRTASGTACRAGGAQPCFTYRTRSGSITNLIRCSPGWRYGYSSWSMYFLASALMCSSARPCSRSRSRGSRRSGTGCRLRTRAR